LAGPLTGKVAIVTGAGRGVGRAVAVALAGAGARIVIADNGTSADGTGADPSIAADVAQALGDAAIAFTDSIASPGAAKAVVDLAVRHFGGLDIVVNGAGIRRDASVIGVAPRDWEAVIRTNLSAPLYLTSAASVAMRTAGRTDDRGRIINVIAPAGLHAGGGQAADASAAAGLLALTQASAFDLAATHVTANAVVPLPCSDAQRSSTDAARLVVALCLPAARAITGRLVGVRGREIFVFDPPRPVACIGGTDDASSPDAVLATLLRHAPGAMAGRRPTEEDR
jgi:NAD(P)-dependent dehydrogenase (short-subunit alcohol dehydrogenase family)